MAARKETSGVPGTRPPDSPLIGIGYRHTLHDWTAAHLDRFEVLEVVVDTHGYPVADGALALYRRMLTSQSPRTVILERDNRLDRP
jgi:uncharacterized protein (UPF0276 family)